MKRLTFFLFLIFSAISLYSLDSFFIVQPCSWAIDDDFNLSEKAKETQINLEEYIDYTEKGFRIRRKNFSLVSDNDDILIFNDRFSIKFSSKNVIVAQNEDYFEISIHTNSLLFILSNNDLKYYISDNEILFPKVGANNNVFAPNDLRVNKYDGIPLADNILYHSDVLIELFGPVNYYDQEKNEFLAGEVMGTFNQSLWIKFEKWGGEKTLFFTPVSVYDNNVVPYLVNKSIK